MKSKSSFKFVGGATILVRIMPATPNMGVRLKVRIGNCNGKTARTYVWDYNLTENQNYEKVAARYAAELGWEGSMIGSYVNNMALFIFND